MNAFLTSYPELQLYWEWLLAQPLAVQVTSGALVVIMLFFGLFVVKNVLLPVLRAFGAATPSTYSYFPRLPWRPVFVLWMRFGRWREHLFKMGKQSSGGFASVVSTLTNTYNAKTDIPLGLVWAWGGTIYQTVGHKISTHMMLVGQSGAGKSVFLKKIICEWNSSMFITDVKGEHRREILSRKTSHQVVALRPYDIETTGQINPFDCLRLAIKLGGQSAGIKWAYRIAHSFIETKSDSKNAFFTDTARGYLAGLILLVETTFEVKDRHLGTVRHLIVNGLPTNDENGVPDDDINVAFESLHEMMMTLPAFSGAIAGAAAPFINAASETKGSLQATLQERSKVLDIPSVRYMLSATTRPIGELKSCNDYVLTVEATVSSIRNELNDVIRLITNTVIYAFEDEEKKNGQCLAVYDEFNACGYNSTIETYLPVLRSMGLSAVPAIQDLEGLKASYPKTFLSFIGNSDLTLWLSSPHPHNLAQLSQILGKKTIVETDSDTGKKSYREVDVATPEQLGRFLASDTGNMIATRAGKRALRLRLNPHFKALGVWQYNSDPEHPEALLRRLTRFILSLFVTHSDDVQAPSSNHSSTKTTHQQPPTKENDS